MDFKNGELACPDSSLNQINLCWTIFECIIPMRGVSEPKLSDELYEQNLVQNRPLWNILKLSRTDFFSSYLTP